VVYKSCWSSLAYSFSGPSPAGLMPIFFSLKFENPSPWKARTLYLYPQEQDGPSTGLQHWIKVRVMLRPTISRPVFLDVRYSSGALHQTFVFHEGTNQKFKSSGDMTWLCPKLLHIALSLTNQHYFT
jgi:hypothetical protein